MTRFLRSPHRSRAKTATLASATLMTLCVGSAGFPARCAAADPPAAAPATPAAPAKLAPAKEDPEVKMGREAHEEMLRSGLKLVQDPKLLDRVTTIGKRLAAVANKTPIPAGYGSSVLVPYDYKFFIVDDPDVNAFSLPGGYIYVNKGLLNYVQSDDELAGVLGHEIEHAAHHHVTKLEHEQHKINNAMALGLLATFLAHVPTADALNLMQGFQLIAIQKVNGFGQTAEQDADHSGLIIESKAGYNPVGMLTFMERLARDQRMRPDLDLGIFRTHPPEKERVESLTAQLREMGVPIKRREVTNSLKVNVRTVLLNPMTPAPVIAGTSGAAGGKSALTTNAAVLPTSTSPAAGAAPTIGVASVTASEVLLDGRVLYRTPSADRAKKAGDLLNHVLDDDVQLYDVTRRGSEVLVRGQVVFDIQPDDLTLPGSLPTVDATAELAYKNMRNALYREFLLNSN